ncbi:LysR family transcriptional regulator [Streptomyces albus]|uniref:LysR substrate-binding domain-containing protein n=1 Tax=Streptomyces albus TaxID=1888 RepID=UPI0013B487FC|nr:LysR substrate-binding domain-containing protein [Streptomyces albus]QID34548.1 LysR family transcriptional regulator [Streptomyces albus]
MNLLNGRLTLRHLVLVAAVAEYGSVLRAARELRLAQPAATRSLREVEKMLRTELFTRGPRGMTPTVCGEAFVTHARSVIAELRRAGERIGELAEGHVGTVTVGTLLAGSNVLLPRAIVALKRQYPGIIVTVREATFDIQAPQLLDGRLDLVVGRLNPLGAQRGLRQIALYDDPVRLVACAGHPATRPDSVGLADLTDYPWALPLGQTALRQELEEVFREAGLSLPADRVECSSITTVWALLTHTDAIAVLPDMVARALPGLAQLPVPLDRVRQRVGVTVADARPLTPVARRMLAHLREQALLMRLSPRCDVPGHDGPAGCAGPAYPAPPALAPGR